MRDISAVAAASGPRVEDESHKDRRCSLSHQVLFAPYQS